MQYSAEYTPLHCPTLRRWLNADYSILLLSPWISPILQHGLSLNNFCVWWWPAAYDLWRLTPLFRCITHTCTRYTVSPYNIISSPFPLPLPLPLRNYSFNFFFLFLTHKKSIVDSFDYKIWKLHHRKSLKLNWTVPKKIIKNNVCIFLMNLTFYERIRKIWNDLRRSENEKKRESNEWHGLHLVIRKSLKLIDANPETVLWQK